MMKREYLYFAIIIILVILIFIALFNNKSNTINTSSNIKNTTTNTINNKTIPNGQVGIVRHNYDKYGEIEVYVKNNTGKTVDRVIITAQCWDKDGNNLGTYTAYQRNVNTTDTYKINVFCSTEMKKYQLKLDYE